MKLNRNSPCPCGSGKKYKKCCLEKDIAFEKKNSIEEINEIYKQNNEMFDEELAARTPAEKAYDNVLLTAYNNGKTIEESIKIANDQYPDEALQYDKSNLDDIETHYEYLSTHLKIRDKFGRINNAFEENKRIVLGIAWYDNSISFEKMKEYSTDKEIWEECYEEWLKNADEQYNEIKNGGIDPIKVKITVDGLKEFCRTRCIKPNAETRADYITFLLQKG